MMKFYVVVKVGGRECYACQSKKGGINLTHAKSRAMRVTRKQGAAVQEMLLSGYGIKSRLSAEDARQGV